MSRDIEFDRQPARSWEQHLRESAIPRRVLDEFLSGPGWAQFDPELGYVPRDSSIKWGIDGSRVVETHEPHGARSHFMYPGRRPRINCYGESFTESIQVSDGETWEEYLAAHLGEPVGNYGVGGYGPYQAYRRMVVQETSDHAGSLIVFYILDASMLRSSMRALWALIHPVWRSSAIDRPLFHGNFWPRLELHLESGLFVERENPLATPADLYRMSDPQWMMSELRDDLAVRLQAFALGMVRDLDRRSTDRLAAILEVGFDWDADDRRHEAALLAAAYGERTTIEVLDRARDFASRSGKQLLVVLNSVATPRAAEAADEGRVLRHLMDCGIAAFDMAAVHRREQSASRLSFDEYLAPYVTPGEGIFSGHYTPRGNHHFAYSIKDSVVEMLKNKPLPYRPDDQQVDVAAYRALRLSSDRIALRPGTEEVMSATVRFGAVLRELQTRFAEPWNVDAIARLAGLSRSGLHRQFAATLKVTPMDYVKQLRLDEAARRLLHSDDTLARVAESVGFSNAFHLSREFTRRFGTTPSAYRRDPMQRTPADQSELNSGI